MTDIKETRTLTLEGALKVLNAAIAEATRIYAERGGDSPRRNLLVCLAAASNTLRIMANA
jgi:hypothetical protein